MRTNITAVCDLVLDTRGKGKAIDKSGNILIPVYQNVIVKFFDELTDFFISSQL